jgi:hypothetical protein
LSPNAAQPSKWEGVFHHEVFHVLAHTYSYQNGETRRMW